ncbi:MAG: hypothetical protein GW762_02125 [Candidatus Pacebacteria bacterium]|nr:hypothetical protein [Candidatus Paceibacterota bacterium]PIR63554.1 MAG: hypothetical protein COU64_03795 [Candidatus Pacebacteria bacterium CG10_big_fil_rev_8_21_14_0_10_40_26]PIZ79209.1 MAG: hypothetical protein COY01_02170 [Candidatus Pacebacteria bacterium CG_4_10_14_0_2_um_filter_40_20]PJA68864.1 MAG: hypothetical protein CO156_02775 [Candidatus Pacebacteria bacterium CG_4_9_14_3_um_filter_40_12]PJC42176.1 MAG: hypothetical protein CO041_00880 [Candidatus Pacebacteria bacterium CG_4_9_
MSRKLTPVLCTYRLEITLAIVFLLALAVGILSVGSVANNYFSNVATEERVFELVKDDVELTEFAFTANNIFLSNQKSFEVAGGAQYSVDFVINTQSVKVTGTYIWGTRMKNARYILTGIDKK